MIRKHKYHLLVALLTSLSTIIGAQNEMIKPVKGSGNLWGYQDKNKTIVVAPIFDHVTPLIWNFNEIEPQLFDIENLFLTNDEIFFRNPVGVVINGDSLGIVDHQGKFLLNPMKCKLRTIYQENAIKVIEILEEGSEDYGKLALIGQSGLFITPFMLCQIEEYDGSRVEPHQYFYRNQAIDDIFLTDCDGHYSIFINQTDGFMKRFPDSIRVTLATNGYYFIESTREQKVNLFHNDKFIKSIATPENYYALNYHTKGIFSMTNQNQNCILMDTSGKVYFTVENGYLEGFNDHGHARIGQNNKINYVDNKGVVFFEAQIGIDYYSNQDGYQLYEEDSIIYFDKSFIKIRTVARDIEAVFEGNKLNSKTFFSICKDSIYYKELLST